MIMVRACFARLVTTAIRCALATKVMGVSMWKRNANRDSSGSIKLMPMTCEARKIARGIHMRKKRALVADRCPLMNANNPMPIVSTADIVMPTFVTKSSSMPIDDGIILCGDEYRYPRVLSQRRQRQCCFGDRGHQCNHPQPRCPPKQFRLLEDERVVFSDQRQYVPIDQF